MRIFIIYHHYCFLLLILGTAQADMDIFPQVDSTWKVCMLKNLGPTSHTKIYTFQLANVTFWINLLQTFNEIQKLLSKTNGKIVGDVMTPAPLVVRETTNLEDAARYFCDCFF